MLKKKLVCLLIGLIAFLGSLKIYAGSSESAEYQQTNHYNTPKGFMNDIQTIFKGSDGYYHMYYLLNSNYKLANDGTEWYHVRTKDWEHFENLGIAIPKFVNGWSAVATGSIFQNSNQFFKDLPTSAIVAYFTSYTDTGQHQYVAYSLDNGSSYQPYNNGKPVMTSQTKEQNARDPYIWYNSNSKRLMMYLAEGDKIGIYASSDGKNWAYQGATVLNQYTLGGKDLGLVECPNLKTFYDSATNTTKHVLFFGANGYQYGSTTGTYYMVGHLDTQGNFVPEQNAERLDQGSDYYGANFYQESDCVVKSIAWMGNWDYLQGQILDDQGQESKHLGSVSSARDITMVKRDDKYVLESYLKNNNSRTNTVSYQSNADTAKLADDGYHKTLLSVSRWHSQELSLKFQANAATLNGHIRLIFKQADAQVSLDYNTDNGYYEVKRTSSKIIGSQKVNYERSYVVDSHWNRQKELNIYLVADKSSLEFALPNGQTYSMVKLSTASDMDIVIETSGSNRLQADLANLET
ncbi:glycoside hydrolase family 32 protein [Streptococcus mutans]|uniref:glycoside hydrolase family 32 protein n=1 Tax=Streptococcus mutans TaxID=1309 RepID=UPI00031C5C8E|nr:glycoside hydrolase family 32 protein [Streptococcus mutans]